MKKLLLTTLMLGIIACGKTEEKINLETINKVSTETTKKTTNKMKENEFVILSYVNDKNIVASINSNNNFETAVLTYRLNNSSDKTILNMKREISASGIIMKSEDKKVEYLAKGNLATFIIDGVEYKTHLVK